MRISSGIVAENNSVCRDFGILLEQTGDRILETHVEHAVDLIEDKHPHRCERQGTLIDQFLDAPRRADDDMRRVCQGGQLRAQGNAATERQQFHVGHETGELADLLADLIGEFPRRAEHDALYAGHGRIEPCDQTEPERGGLAAAGRRLGNDIPFFKNGRQAQCLHGRHFGVLERVEGAEQGRINGERSEGSHAP